MYDTRGFVDYAVTDPFYYDPNFPPTHFPMSFMSAGSPVQAFMYLASGPGPHPCVIFSPQAHGGDCLESLIPPLVGAGIHVLRFWPRGMWDNNHVYAFDTHLDDLHAAVAHLLENGGKHSAPDRREYHINPERIAVFGKSGGGGCIGWGVAAENPHLNTAIAVHPSNIQMSQMPLSPETKDQFDRWREATAGRIDLESWMSNMPLEAWDRMDLIKQAPKLVSKNLLLIAGSSDYLTDFDTNHKLIAQAQRDAGAKHFTEVILEGDAFFLTARIAMARLVINWLKTECDF